MSHTACTWRCICLQPPTKPQHQDPTHFPWWAALIIGLIGGLLTLFVAGCMWLPYGTALANYRLAPGKKRPPSCANGKPVTLVMTDVEGSTSLWVRHLLAFVTT